MLPGLLALLSQVQTWKKCDKSQYDVASYQVTLNDGITTSYSKMDLDKIDERLWQTLEYLSETLPNSRLIPVQLVLTLKHWLGLLPMSPEIGHYAIISYDKVFSDNTHCETVNLAVSVGEIAMVGNIEVVKNCLVTQAALPYAWLEETIPGAISRMRAAKGLLMSPSEQAYHMMHGQDSCECFTTELPDAAELLA